MIVLEDLLLDRCGDGSYRWCGPVQRDRKQSLLLSVARTRYTLHVARTGQHTPRSGDRSGDVNLF